MDRRRRLWLGRSIALALSSLFSLGVVELGLRLSDAYGGQAYSVNPTGSQYKFYRFDPVLGWANAPGMQGIYERDEFRFPIRVNAFGMRDAEVEREPGALVIRGHPLPDIDDFGFRERAEGFLLARILGKAISNGFLLPEQAGLVGFQSDWIYDPTSLRPEDKALADRAIRINEALLARIRDAVRGAGATLVLLPVPTKCEYSARCRRAGEVRVREAANRVLAETAVRLGVPFVPTLDVLELSDFWEKDGHWRPSGHARIAERLGSFLVREGLLD